MPRRGIRRFLHIPRSARRIRADIDEELEFDVEMRAQALMQQGLTPDAARQRALAEFGDLEGTRDYCTTLDLEHEMAERRSDWLDDLRSDVAIAWRAMRRGPAFAVIVLLTLALGIGANTAIFSVVRRVLIAPLPYRAPDQLYRLYTVPASPQDDDDKLSAAELNDLATDSRSLAGVTWFGNYGGVTYSDASTAELWRTVSVAPSFFDVLGVRPALGRPILESDLDTGGSSGGSSTVVLISDSLWHHRFGGDPGIIGRKVQLNDVSFTIIGVLPPSFVGPTFNTDALLPLNVPAFLRNARASRWRIWRAVARVKAGVTQAQLESELGVVRVRLQARYPEIKNAGAIRPVPLRRAIVGGVKPVLLVVMVGALLVLVIMCVNIAGLFLSRAAARRRELGIRSALGAGQGRLMRQVLTETAAYGLAGGALGAALAFTMKNALVRLAATILPSMGEVHIDASVLVFAGIVSLACGLAFGILPARAATRLDLRDAIGDSGSGARGASQGRAHVRGARLLVAAQIAFAVVLVVGAGLLARTFVALIDTNVGYATDDHILSFAVNLPSARFRADAGAAVTREFLERVRAIPGIKAAGLTRVAPWQGGYETVRVRAVRGARSTDENAAPTADYEIASDGFFEALGIPLLAGRGFLPTDRAGAPPVVVVSQSTARKLWPGGNAVGAQVRLETGGPDSLDVRQVIGVVGDIRPSVTEDPIATIYASTWQHAVYGGQFAVRTGADARAAVDPIKRVLRDVDPRLPLLMPHTVHDILRRSIARQQLAMSLMAAFAVLALVLAAMGIYSVMAYSVLARTREFGVRAALGAQRRSILFLVLRQGLATTIVGAICGLALAMATTRYLASLLTGVSTHDVLTLVGAPILLVAVAAAACTLPALRATRVQPVDALRVE